MATDSIVDKIYKSNIMRRFHHYLYMIFTILLIILVCNIMNIVITIYYFRKLLCKI